MRRAWLLGLLLLPGVARADKEGDAIRLLDEGFELFKKGDPDSLAKARADFEQARALFPEKANAYRLLGLTDARLGHCEGAIKNLDTFAKLAKKDDPRIAEVATIRDQCLDRLGGLAVDSTPPGAEVRLDSEAGAPVGVTPWRGDQVAVGAHTVYVRKEGFAPWTKSVSVERRGSASVSAQLVAQAAVAEAPASGAKPSRRTLFIAGGAAAAVVVVAVVIGVIVGVSGHASTPFETAVRFPAVMGN